MKRLSRSLAAVTAMTLLGCWSPTSPAEDLSFGANVAVEVLEAPELLGELTVVNHGDEAITLSWGGCDPPFRFAVVARNGNRDDAWSEPGPPANALCSAVLSQVRLAPGDSEVIARTLSADRLQAYGLPMGRLEFVLTPTFRPRVNRSVPAGIVEWQ